MNELLERFLKVRSKTLEICKNLETEDYVVQPAAFVSPIKWHIGHVTWFFDNLVINNFMSNYKSEFEKYNKVFNSYYKSQGDHWLQSNRGDLSRPTVDDILKHRARIDSRMIEIINSSSLSQEVIDLIIVGINHEEQHQELILMDIKYILSLNVDSPAYINETLDRSTSIHLKNDPILIEEGLYEIGHRDLSFSYDNELPTHKVYLHGCELDNDFITNGDYLSFINDKAYQNSNLWLSDGWDWIQKGNISHPLYWINSNTGWKEFTLYGLNELDKSFPVSHVNYYEAEAFARWSGKRLPYESELEVSYKYKQQREVDKPYHSTNAKQLECNLWTWSQSPYTPYPGYKPFEGSLSEYNGKFMCNQFVLRGGCLLNSQEHYRESYRNFYRPEQNWMFSGIRLAKDLK